MSTVQILPENNTNRNTVTSVLAIEWSHDNYVVIHVNNQEKLYLYNCCDSL